MHKFRECKFIGYMCIHVFVCLQPELMVNKIKRVFECHPLIVWSLFGNSFRTVTVNLLHENK